MRIHQWSGDAISGELIHAAAGTTLVGHTHDVPHALVVLDGVVTDDGRPYCSRDVRVSPPGDPHFVRFQTPCTCLLVLSSDRHLPTVAERRSGRLPKALERHFKVLAGGSSRTPTHGELGGFVGETIAALEDVTELGGVVPVWLRELRSHVVAGSHAGSDTQSVARRAGVSREHLSRSFRRHFGTSFVTFRSHQRVAAACRLMRAAPWPLAEVACAAGFADQSHMTRAFVRCLGTTPAAYRLRATSQTFKTADAPDR